MSTIFCKYAFYTLLINAGVYASHLFSDVVIDDDVAYLVQQLCQ